MPVYARRPISDFVREEKKKRKTTRPSPVRSYLGERLRVGDLQTPHAVLVPRFLEVPLVGPSTPVRVVPTDLARELQV